MKRIYFIIIAVLLLQSSFAANGLTFDPPSFSYPQVVYCQDSPNAVPVFGPGSNTSGVFFASPIGILINNITGEINCVASAPGTYVITYIVIGSGEEPTYAVESYVTIVEATQLQPMTDVSACAFYVLPQIYSGNYYSGPNGTGSAYYTGDVILSSMQMHVFSPGQEPCMQADDVNFMININTIDISVSYNGAAFGANQEDAGYQWAICSDPPVFLEGETQQYFFPTQNGDYTVLISKGDCDAYSQCFTVDFLGTNDNLIDGLAFAPNPFNDQIQVLSKQNFDEIVVYNTIGQLVFSQKKVAGNTKLDLSALPKGNYFIRTISGNNFRTSKLLKN